MRWKMDLFFISSYYNCLEVDEMNISLQCSSSLKLSSMWDFVNTIGNYRLLTSIKYRLVTAAFLKFFSKDPRGKVVEKFLSITPIFCLS